MEENTNKFMDKMKELLAFAKKKKNVLEYQEINDFLSDTELDAGQIEKIYEFLESNGVDILRVENFSEEENDDLEPDVLLDDEEVEDCDYAGKCYECCHSRTSSLENRHSHKNTTHFVSF